MKNRYRMYVRGKFSGGKVWVCQDNQTGKRESLHTTDKNEARRLLDLKNQPHNVTGFHVQMARTHLLVSDPQSASRTWQTVMSETLKKLSELKKQTATLTDALKSDLAGALAGAHELYSALSDDDRASVWAHKKFGKILKKLGLQYANDTKRAEKSAPKRKSGKKTRRPMSAAAKARIGKAKKKWWAAQRAAKT